MGDVRFKARWRSNENRARFSEIPRETDGKRVRGDDKSIPRLREIFTVARGRALCFANRVAFRACDRLY